MTYSIFDPTGNITALIEGSCSSEEIADLMRADPEIEQAGFVREAYNTESGFDAVLEMAGGEFCGNASMCAAAWLAIRKNAGDMKARLKVSGTEEPVDVFLKKNEDGGFQADVLMPKALEIRETVLSDGEVSGSVPLVKWEGLSHVIIEEGSVFSYLGKGKAGAEAAVKNWCRSLSAKGLGLMFLKGNGERLEMAPLVYIPGSDTIFWEHSCASGSSAAGMYLAQKTNREVTAELAQPGGVLKVKSGPGSADTWLSGNVKLISKN